MTQPDRPDRAAVEQGRTDRVAATLRHAAQSYEPDGERIRRLMDTRSGGSLVVTEPRPARGVPGRALWPVLGSAAAAAVIFAVAAAGADPGGEDPADGVRPVVASPTSGDTSDSEPAPTSGTSPAATTSPALRSPTSTSLTGSTHATGAPSSSTGAPAPHGTSSPAHGTRSAAVATSRPAASHPAAATTTTRSGAETPRPGPGGATTPPPPRSPVKPPPKPPVKPAATAATIGGRQLTASVQPISGGQAVSLGGSGEFWLVASATADQPRSEANTQIVGPVQSLGPGMTADASPFSISWRGGSPSATGTAATWLTSTSALRLPVRFRAEPATIVLYVGTVGGGGRLVVSVPGSGTMPVELPDCSGTCGAIVTVSMHSVQANLPTTGDLVFDAFAAGGGKIGIAAAALF
jgi:hypothetical protein